MSVFLVPVAVFLAAVFAVSALGKLRAADRGRAAFTALRIPARHATAAATGLIGVEAIVAVGLITTTGIAFVGFATAALVLSAALLVAVVRAHRLGAAEDCGCFGDWLPAAIGPRLIARNVILTVISGCLLAVTLFGVAASVPVGVPSALVSTTSILTTLGAVGSGLLITVGVWSLVRASNPETSTSGSPTRGSGAVLRVDTAEIIDVLAPSARARLLVFVAPGCHACAAALESLRGAETPLGAVVDIYVIQRVAHGSATAQWTHDLPASARFVLDVGGSVGATLEIGPATPVAALIGTDGRQTGPLAVGSDEIDMLIDSIRALVDIPSV